MFIPRGVALALLLITARPTMADETVAVPTRPGVTETIYVTAAPNPAAIVLLFPGGNGRIGSVRNNFLLRAVPRFVALGVTTVAVDTPSDQPAGQSDTFRMSAEQATDIAAVITLIRQRASVPVWLVGTSRGTISAASVAARLGPPRVAGAVLTSTVWRSAIPQVPLENIRVPVLVVHNRDDGCHESPFSEAQTGLARLRMAPAKEFIAVSGGTSRSKPCEALSPHGYYGIEDRVVPPIVTWIKTH